MQTVSEQQRGRLSLYIIFAAAQFIRLNPQETRKDKETGVSTETIEHDLMRTY